MTYLGGPVLAVTKEGGLHGLDEVVHALQTAPDLQQVDGVAEQVDGQVGADGTGQWGVSGPDDVGLGLQAAVQHLQERRLLVVAGELERVEVEHLLQLDVLQHLLDVLLESAGGLFQVGQVRPDE